VRVAGDRPIPLLWYQGVASDHTGHLYFSGPAVGLYRTDRRLRPQRATPRAVPRRERYDHIGDLAWDPRAGGRLLLPLECYAQGRRACRSGAVGVADPATLRWRYLVPVDRAAAAKVMWLAWQPGSGRLWTSSGRDLIAFAGADVHPGARALRPVVRLRGAAPRGGVTGGAFWRGRLWLAAGDLTLWEVDVRTGAGRRRLALRRRGESEGLDAGAGGLLWQVQPRIRSLRSLLLPGHLLRIV
jgi:hypothetical protein